MSLKTIINGIDVGRQRGAASSLPDRVDITTSTEWLGGTQTRTVVAAAAPRQSGRTFAIDADYPDALLGSGMAPSPPELLVAALGASFATSFVLVAAAADVRIESLRVYAEASIGAEEPLGGVHRGPMLPACQLGIEVHANAAAAVLEKISRQALEGCSVAALCRINVHVQMQFKDNVRDAPGVRNKQDNVRRSET